MNKGIINCGIILNKILCPSYFLPTVTIEEAEVDTWRLKSRRPAVVQRKK